MAIALSGKNLISRKVRYSKIRQQKRLKKSKELINID